ncbi:hypothetical protein KKE78_05610 [Patescibacteria group bacterium]|nr:hypothetical protein [Patescibacteria group bacterium]
MRLVERIESITGRMVLPGREIPRQSPFDVCGLNSPQQIESERRGGLDEKQRIGLRDYLTGPIK